MIKESFLHMPRRERSAVLALTLKNRKRRARRIIGNFYRDHCSVEGIAKKMYDSKLSLNDLKSITFEELMHTMKNDWTEKLVTRMVERILKKGGMAVGGDYGFDWKRFNPRIFGTIYMIQFHPRCVFEVTICEKDFISAAGDLMERFRCILEELYVISGRRMIDGSGDKIQEKGLDVLARDGVRMEFGKSLDRFFGEYSKWKVIDESRKKGNFIILLKSLLDCKKDVEDQDWIDKMEKKRIIFDFDVYMEKLRIKLRRIVGKEETNRVFQELRIGIINDDCAVMEEIQKTGDVVSKSVEMILGGSCMQGCDSVCGDQIRHEMILDVEFQYEKDLFYKRSTWAGEDDLGHLYQVHSSRHLYDIIREELEKNRWVCNERLLQLIFDTKCDILRISDKEKKMEVRRILDVEMVNFDFLVQKCSRKEFTWNCMVGLTQCLYEQMCKCMYSPHKETRMESWEKKRWSESWIGFFNGFVGSNYECMSHKEKVGVMLEVLYFLMNLMRDTTLDYSNLEIREDYADVKRKGIEYERKRLKSDFDGGLICIKNTIQLITGGMEKIWESLPDSIIELLDGSVDDVRMKCREFHTFFSLGLIFVKNALKQANFCELYKLDRIRFMWLRRKMVEITKICKMKVTMESCLGKTILQKKSFEGLSFYEKLEKTIENVLRESPRDPREWAEKVNSFCIDFLWKYYECTEVSGGVNAQKNMCDFFSEIVDCRIKGDFDDDAVNLVLWNRIKSICTDMMRGLDSDENSVEMRMMPKRLYQELKDIMAIFRRTVDVNFETCSFIYEKMIPDAAAMVLKNSL